MILETVAGDRPGMFINLLYYSMSVIVVLASAACAGGS